MEESRTHPSQLRTTDTACTWGNRRHHRSTSPRCEERSDESEPLKPVKTTRIKDLMEMVRKRIDKDKSQPRGGPGSSIMRISDFTHSEITSHRFSKKFVIPSFDRYTGITEHYTRVTDPVQHLHAYLVTMALHPMMISSCVRYF